MEYNVLHHYTSVSTMELILKHRTIRFNNLKNVNDKEEVQTTGLDDFGRYCLVSCWTYLNHESLLHWERYTPDAKGVRISLPVNPFDPAYDVYEYLFHNKMIRHRLPFSTQYCEPLPYPDIIKVHYTNDERFIIPNTLLQGSYDEAVLCTRILGIYKRATWSDEKEVRYRILLEPSFYSINHGGEAIPSYDIETCEMHWRAYGDICPFKPLNYLDFKLRDECIDNVKITIGPNNSQKEKCQIIDIIRKYCKNPKIVTSSLLYDG